MDDDKRGVAPGVRTEEVIKAAIWRNHLAGVSPEQSAAEINAKWGARGFSCTAQSVSGWAARHTARRGPRASTRLGRLSQLEAGLEVLRGELATAYANFEADTHPTGRVGACIALRAVCDFVAGFVDVPGGKLDLPLQSLVQALAELDEGIVHPMLERPRLGHRPPAGEAADTLVSFAVLALEAALPAEPSVDAAARRVARDLKRRGYRMANGREIEAATIRNWRARAAEGPGGTHDGAARRLAFVRKAKAEGVPSSRSAYSDILAGLDHWARATGVRKKPRA